MTSRTTRKRLIASVAGLLTAGAFGFAAYAAMWTGLPLATLTPGSLAAVTLPLTGTEVGAFDTGLSGGRNPQTETISVDQLKVYMFGNLGATTAVTVAASGTTYVSDFATCNSGRCLITSSALTTAAAEFYTPTVLNSIVTASSIVTCSVQKGTATTGQPAMVTVATGTGVFTPLVRNILTNPALNGTIKISCTVVN